MLASHIAQELKIHFEIEINAPPEKVWAKLASHEGMAEWFSKNLEIDFHEGGVFKMHVNMGDQGEFIFFGNVVKVDPLRELAFTWSEHEKGKEAWTVSTLVSFKLKPSPNGTLVSLTHTGFEALEGQLAKDEYEGHIVGWERSAALEELKAAVEKAG